MHTCILNGTKPCITEMEIKNVPLKTQPELMFKRYADLNNIHDFTCLIVCINLTLGQKFFSICN